MLTDPDGHGGGKGDPAFEIIAPSIPGYGWSDAPHKKGFGPIAAARIFGKLMDRLGHHVYYVQGGDWGSLIGTVMAQIHPRRFAFHPLMSYLY